MIRKKLIELKSISLKILKAIPSAFFMIYNIYLSNKTDLFRFATFDQRKFNSKIFSYFFHEFLLNLSGPTGGRRGTVEPSGVYTRNNDAAYQDCTFSSFHFIFRFFLSELFYIFG